jgi:hypothetical protein
MKKILLLSAALIITSSCSKNTKRTLGITESMPDEYQVTRNKSLEIPPFYQKDDLNQNISNSKNKLSEEEKSLLKDIE